MNFDLTPDQQQIRETVLKLCAQFDDQYWLARDKDGRFPEDFCRAIADAGASIKDIAHDRAFSGPDVSAVHAVCTVETRDRGHIKALHRALRLKGFPLTAL
jgi:hypothetical protein